MKPSLTRSASASSTPRGGVLSRQGSVQWNRTDVEFMSPDAVFREFSALKHRVKSTLDLRLGRLSEALKCYKSMCMLVELAKERLESSAAGKGFLGRMQSALAELENVMQAVALAVSMNKLVKAIGDAKDRETSEAKISQCEEQLAQFRGMPNDSTKPLADVIADVERALEKATNGGRPVTRAQRIRGSPRTPRTPRTPRGSHTQMPSLEFPSPRPPTSEKPSAENTMTSATQSPRRKALKQALTLDLEQVTRRSRDAGAMDASGSPRTSGGGSGHVATSMRLASDRRSLSSVVSPRVAASVRSNASGEHSVVESLRRMALERRSSHESLARSPPTASESPRARMAALSLTNLSSARSDRSASGSLLFEISPRKLRPSTSSRSSISLANSPRPVYDDSGATPTNRPGSARNVLPGIRKSGSGVVSARVPLRPRQDGGPASSSLLFTPREGGYHMPPLLDRFSANLQAAFSQVYSPLTATDRIATHFSLPSVGVTVSALKKLPVVVEHRWPNRAQSRSDLEGLTSSSSNSLAATRTSTATSITATTVAGAASGIGLSYSNLASQYDRQMVDSAGRLDWVRVRRFALEFESEWAEWDERREQSYERYWWYVSNGLEESDLVTFDVNEHFADALKFVRDASDLDAETIDRVIADVVKDIRNYYYVAVRRSVLDYVLISPIERMRLGIPHVPPSTAFYGHIHATMDGSTDHGDEDDAAWQSKGPYRGRGWHGMVEYGRAGLTNRFHLHNLELMQRSAQALPSSVDGPQLVLHLMSDLISDVDRSLLLDVSTHFRLNVLPLTVGEFVDRQSQFIESVLERWSDTWLPEIESVFGRLDDLESLQETKAQTDEDRRKAKESESADVDAQIRESIRMALRQNDEVKREAAKEKRRADLEKRTGMSADVLQTMKRKSIRDDTFRLSLLQRRRAVETAYAVLGNILRRVVEQSMRAFATMVASFTYETLTIQKNAFSLNGIEPISAAKSGQNAHITGGSSDEPVDMRPLYSIPLDAGLGASLFGRYDVVSGNISGLPPSFTVFAQFDGTVDRKTPDDIGAPELTLDPTLTEIQLQLDELAQFLVGRVNGFVSLEALAPRIRPIVQLVLNPSAPSTKDDPTKPFDHMDGRAFRALPICRGDDDSLQHVRLLVRQVVAHGVRKARRSVKAFSEYFALLRPASCGVDASYEAQIDRFMAETYAPNRPHILECSTAGVRALKKVKEEVLRYRRLASDIIETLPDEVRSDMFRVVCRPLKELLRDRALYLADSIATTLMDDARQLCNRICGAFSAMKERVSFTPSKSEELVALQGYIRSCAREVSDLDGDISGVRLYMKFFFDVDFVMSADDALLHGETLHWPVPIAGILARASDRLKQARQSHEDKFLALVAKFESELEFLRGEVKQFEGYGQFEYAADHCETITQLEHSLKQASARVPDLNQTEVMFSWTPTEFTQIREIRERLEPFAKLWRLALECQEKFDEWVHDTPIQQMDIEGSERDMKELWRQAHKLDRYFRAFPVEDANGERDGDVEELQAAVGITSQCKEIMDEFKDHFPLLQTTGHPGLRDRHWKEISQICGKEVRVGEMTTLQDVLDWHIETFLDEIRVVSDQAGKEYMLEMTLQRMKHDWRGVKFECLQWRETGTWILSGGPVEDVQTLLDDHVVKTQTMQCSPFIGPFLGEAKAWEELLVLVQDSLEAWLLVQSTWIYLEPIFGSKDIQNQLPDESEKFFTVDQLWRKCMAGTMKVPFVLERIEKERDLLKQLRHANELLDEIQAGLNQYLETKRLYFPRFFFLSNEELLEILSDTKDPLRIQPHIGKCFEGIGSLEFNRASMNIVAMCSTTKERVEFAQPVDPNQYDGAVEKWLLDVEHAMKRAVKDVSRGCMEDFEAGSSFSEWVVRWPGQAVLTVHQIYWTRGVTKALEKETVNAVSEFRKKCEGQLQALVDLVRSSSLTLMQRITLGAMVTICVHLQDIVDELLEVQCVSKSSFDWLAQLRYYWEDEVIRIRMMHAALDYGYEYLGNTGRLVITPLTVRCYRTLMSALHLNLGGAPEGPAGTGKTETCKDLAKSIAKQCVVFNCSDGLDYLAMGKFFKGLASAGAWSCFDEFNRIDLEVLSVIAQQIMSIQHAIAAQVKDFMFEGTRIKLDPSCSVFITMNPGYAGRQELPDNLKALFRPVAMMVPDYALIAEISLLSYGFKYGRALSKKIVAVYRLCSEQLSSQDHYDYGMRAVKAVLTAAGNLKRAFPGDDENVLVLRSITDVNLPKFLTEDVELFKGITSDLFPGVSLPNPDYDVLTAAIRKACSDAHILALPAFIDKVIQLYEMTIVRHGLMLVGRSYSGKTSAYRVLVQALTAMYNNLGAEKTKERPVKVHVVNPKAVSMGQLYGDFDPISHEWSDGILPHYFRMCVNDREDTRKWMLFDGPVDAIWIENMNSVLDDSKKLCLVSGEIIQMTADMNLIFEVQDLAVASPATVSRCGMVYMEPEQVGWKSLVTSWLDWTASAAINGNAAKLYGWSTADQIRKCLDGMFAWLVPPCLGFLRRECTFTVPQDEMHLVRSLTSMFHAVTRDLLSEFDDRVAELLKKHQSSANMGGKDGGEARPTSGKTKIALDIPLPDSWKERKLDDAGAFQQWIECSFVFALTWSLGAAVDTASRPKFDAFLQRCLHADTPDAYSHGMGAPLILKQLPPKANNTTVFDVTYNVEQGKWIKWSDMCSKDPSKEIPDNATVSRLIVPTVDTVRYRYLLARLIKSGRHVCLVGPTGTGKTAYMKGYVMDELPRDSYERVLVHFSARTSANQTQDIIDQQLTKRKRGVFGPPLGRNLVIVVDDLNMPQTEKYGAQPPLELLRQLMDHQEWYDFRDRKTLRHVVDFTIGACMGPPGGGRNAISNRVARHFNVISVAEFDDATKERIFGSILKWFFQTNAFASAVCDLEVPLIRATLSVYDEVTKHLLPTPRKSHYTFNLRDLSRVVSGLLFMHPKLFQERRDVFRLWSHEVYRVFGDRLVDREDKVWFGECVKQVMNETLHEDFDACTENAGEDPRPVAKLDGLMYGQIAIRGRNVPTVDSLPAYSHLPTMKDIAASLHDSLGDLNQVAKTPLDLVLFPYAMQHILRLCRILRQPQGNALLVGYGGAGRQSYTQVAAHLVDYDYFRVEISGSYGLDDWREDMRKLLRQCGVSGRDTVFLITEPQLKMEAFVEDLNNMLNTGEIPNLFPADERALLLEDIRERAKESNAVSSSPTESELFHWFVDECQQHLHIVLCMSPAGDTFRERLRQFPSLVNCCSIDWFHDWPNAALLAVAQQRLKPLQVPSSKVREGLAVACEYMHGTVVQLTADFIREQKRFSYVTPTSYLELLGTYCELLKSRREIVEKKRKRFENGIERMYQTEKSIQKMQRELEILKPNLVNTQRDIAEFTRKVEKDSAEVEETKKIVEKEETVANEKAKVAKGIRDECEAELNKALPVLKSAIRALDTLTSQDIFVVKSMTNPPQGVRLVMEAVCIMRGIAPKRELDPTTGKRTEDYWKPSQALLSNSNQFLESLKNYDKDNLDQKILVRIERDYIPNPNFLPEKVVKASSAAEGMCKWVRAIVEYDHAMKIVGPKQQTLKEAEREYDVLMVSLNEKREQLSRVLARQQELKDELVRLEEKKVDLERQVHDCAVKLERAQTLIGDLGGEKSRWEQQILELQRQHSALIGDVLLASGLIAYLGPFTVPYRSKCLTLWMKKLRSLEIPCSEGEYSLPKLLGDPVAIRGWHIDGLPSDAFSTDNGIMAVNSRRWPLMIDPEGQANRWIKSLEQGNNLTVVKPSDSNLLRTLENAIRFGQPVLLEQIGESLNPALDGVLTRSLFKQGGVACIRLGDATVEWSDDFRLYLTTKLRNPHYLPSISVKVTLLNFMITPEALQDQMLGAVVAAERPELEDQKNDLIMQSADNDKKLVEVQDRILVALQTEGNLLEDENAIKVLKESKEISTEISAKQVEIVETERKIDEIRSQYTEVAHRAATLFFCLSSLSSLDPMYQFSLDWYQLLFVRSIGDAERSNDLRARIYNINRMFLSNLYAQVSRSLFEKDKLVFSFSMCAYVLKAENRLSFAEWQFLLTGRATVAAGDDDIEVDDDDDGDGHDGPLPNPCGEWISDKAWEELQELSKLPSFGGVGRFLLHSFNSAKKMPLWKQWYLSPEPFDCRPPRLKRPPKSISDAIDSMDSASDSGPLSPRGGRSAHLQKSLRKQISDKAVRKGAKPVEKEEDTWTPLQKLVLVRLLRPDRFVSSVVRFVRGELGAEFVTDKGFDLATVYDESTPTSPLIFVLSPGADPMQQLMSFATTCRLQNKVDSVSLGQGQGPIAAKMIERGIKQGRWVVLQNCHLAPSWMSELERLCDEMDPADCHSQFRLWLTSYPSPDFPVSILQNSVKMTNEPPTGLKSNLMRSFATDPISDEQFYNNNHQFRSVEQADAWRKLLYCMCFFHAVVQERRGFGGLGWNIPYQFNESDLRISVRQLQQFVNIDAADIPFKALLYLTGECNYGGRVTDDWDRRLLRTLLSSFINEHALEDDFPLSSTGIYRVPADCAEFEEYSEYIQSLPADESPDVYGLHSNAEITKNRREATALVHAIQSIQTDQLTDTEAVSSRDGEGESEEKAAASSQSPQDTIVSTVARDILEKMPGNFDVEMAHRKFPVSYNQSMNTVLCHELIRFNKLLSVIRRSLEAVRKAIRGEVVMSAELEQVSHAIFENRVPSLWAASSYPSLKPLGAYISDLLERLQFFSKWIDSGTTPVVYWVSGFYFTQSFLTGALQNYARKYTIPIDELEFDFEFLSADPETPPEDGVYIRGLYFEACKWDNSHQQMAESAPRELYDASPVIWFRPCRSSELSEYPHYRCPVYKTSARRGTLSTTGHSTNYVMAIRVPSDMDQDHWVKRGVALLCQLDE